VLINKCNANISFLQQFPRVIRKGWQDVHHVLTPPG